MRWRRSLRFRFVAGIAAIAILALAGTGLTLSELFRREIARQVETRLASHLDRLALVVAIEDGKPVLTRPILEPRFAVPYSGLYWQIAGVDGDALRSRSLWDATLPNPSFPIEERAPEGRRQQLVAGPDGDDVLTHEEVIYLSGSETPWALSVATATTEITEPVAEFQWLLISAFGGLTLVILAGSTLAGWIGFRPLEDLRRALDRIRARKVTRLDGDRPTELEPLVETLNGLLEDREQSIERARTQAGNLAHALKTPLAIIANEASTFERTGNAAQAKVLNDAVEAMERHIHHQLARSRAAAAARGAGLGTELLPVAERLATAMPMLHPDKPIDLSIDIPPALTARIDSEDVTEILGNLLDNAFI